MLSFSHLASTDLKPLDVQCRRMVESQESVATNAIVDTLAEQAVLEDLLEKSKPNLLESAVGLHYLLATPFRYPPLKWGSRFGLHTEHGIFYASLQTQTLLHEVAYYTFVLLDGLQTPLPKPLKKRHTEFSVHLQGHRAVFLNDSKFDGVQLQLQDASDYTFTQRIGAQMRTLCAQAFVYHSARDPKQGLNVGVFDPACFAGQAPRGEREWFCQVEGSNNCVTFYCPSTKHSAQFPVDLYQVDGVLPRPAV